MARNFKRQFFWMKCVKPGFDDLSDYLRPVFLSRVGYCVPGGSVHSYVVHALPPCFSACWTEAYERKRAFVSFTTGPSILKSIRYYRWRRKKSFKSALFLVSFWQSRFLLLFFLVRQESLCFPSDWKSTKLRPFLDFLLCLKNQWNLMTSQKKCQIYFSNRTKNWQFFLEELKKYLIFWGRRGKSASRLRRICSCRLLDTIRADSTGSSSLCDLSRRRWNRLCLSASFPFRLFFRDSPRRRAPAVCSWSTPFCLRVSKRVTKHVIPTFLALLSLQPSIFAALDLVRLFRFFFQLRLHFRQIHVVPVCSFVLVPMTVAFVARVPRHSSQHFLNTNNTESSIILIHEAANTVRCYKQNKTSEYANYWLSVPLDFFRPDGPLQRLRRFFFDVFRHRLAHVERVFFESVFRRGAVIIQNSSVSRVAQFLIQLVRHCICLSNKQILISYSNLKF